MLENPRDVFDATWLYRAVITQTAAGGGTIEASFTPITGEEFEVLYGTIGPDDYSGEKAVEVQITDSASRRVGKVTSDSIDNEQLPLPILSSTTTPANIVPTRLFVSGDDKLLVLIASLSQNETLTIQLRFRLRARPPVVTVATTGTVSTSTTYNKVG